MNYRQRTSTRVALAFVLAAGILLSVGCSSEVSQPIFAATEAGLKTIADGLISALFIAFSGGR